MSGELRARHMEGERWKMEARLADPPSTLEGECWIRPDLAPEPDQLGTLRVDVGNSTLDVPIFAGGTSSADIEESLRIQLNNDVGYVPLAPLQDATYPELRVQQSSGTYGMHDAVEVSAIPDSVVSRPGDNAGSGATFDTKLGLAFEVNSEFEEIGFELSSFCDNPTRAYIYDNDAASQINSVDISGLTGGDTFTIPADYQTGVEYIIWVDAEGSSYGFGYYTSASYPYTSSDVNITSGADENETDNLRNNAYNILSIGNVGFS